MQVLISLRFFTPSLFAGTIVCERIAVLFRYSRTGLLSAFFFIIARLPRVIVVTETDQTTFFQNVDFKIKISIFFQIFVNKINLLSFYTKKHVFQLIFFHGLGDTGHGWASSMGAVRSPHIKVICPTAPTMPVTFNAGFRMPSWFDLRSLDSSGPEDEEGIRKAAETVHSLIAEEVAAGIPTTRIVLGGFSQGGALAMYSALTFPEPLAGIIALSAWLPLHQKFPAEAIGNRNTPLIQCHGDCDPIVPYRWGQMTASLLKQFMTQTEFKTYRGMMHTSSEEEMRDIKKFIEKVLKP